MFHAHHHRSIFPLLVVAITLALGAILVWLYVPRVRVSSVRSVVNVSYESEAGRVLATLDERLVIAATNEAKEDVVSAAGAEFLALRVPGSFKDAHLQMVIVLDQLRRAYASNSDVLIEEAIQRFANVRASLSL